MSEGKGVAPLARCFLQASHFVKATQLSFETKPILNPQEVLPKIPEEFGKRKWAETGGSGRIYKTF